MQRRGRNPAASFSLPENVLDTWGLSPAPPLDTPTRAPSPASTIEPPNIVVRDPTGFLRKLLDIASYRGGALNGLQIVMDFDRTMTNYCQKVEPSREHLQGEKILCSGMSTIAAHMGEAAVSEERTLFDYYRPLERAAEENLYMKRQKLEEFGISPECLESGAQGPLPEETQAQWVKLQEEYQLALKDARGNYAKWSRRPSSSLARTVSLGSAW